MDDMVAEGQSDEPLGGPPTPLLNLSLGGTKRRTCLWGIVHAFCPRGRGLMTGPEPASTER